MSNTILTNDVVAARAIAALEQEQVMPELVYSDYSNEYASAENGYKRGQTIRVPIEPSLTGEVWNGSTVTAQAFTESHVDVALDEIIDVTVDFTSYESTTDIDILSDRVIVPAMRAISQKINTRCLEVYAKAVPYYSGTAGTAPSAISDYTNIAQVLDDNLCPQMDRRLVINPAAKNKLQQITTFHEADKVGDAGSALRTGSIGEKFGLQTFMSQGVYSHTKGTLAANTAAGAIYVKGAVSSGATSMTLDQNGSGTLTGTLAVGDILKITDASTSAVSYVAVDTAATAAANEIAVSCSTTDLDIADNSTVEVVGSHAANLAFNKDAFAFVSRPLNAQVGAGASGVIINPFNQQAVRWTLDYNQNTKKSQLCFDGLVGYKLLNKKLAARLLG